MAATLSDLGKIAKDEDFQSRVAMAMMTAAVNVFAESQATAGHPARLAYSRIVFTGGVNLTFACMMVLTNSTIAASANLLTTPGFAIVDSDIQFVVNSLWNDYAGV